MCYNGPLCWLVGIVEAWLFHFIFSFEHCFRRQWAWSRCNGRGEASQIIWIKIVSTQRERGLIHVLSSTSSFWDINGMSASSFNLFPFSSQLMFDPSAHAFLWLRETCTYSSTPSSTIRVSLDLPWWLLKIIFLLNIIISLLSFPPSEFSHILHSYLLKFKVSFSLCFIVPDVYICVCSNIRREKNDWENIWKTQRTGNKKWTKGITLKSTKRRGHYEYKHRNNTDDKKS